MLTVHFDHFGGSRASLNGTRRLAVRTLDIARAVALTHAGVDLDPYRRLARLNAIAGEVLAHLEISAPAAGQTERLRILGLSGLDGSARAELSHRVGIGLARVVAESTEIGLVDLYSLDALSREHAAPRMVRLDGARRQPDFVGSDSSGRWSLLEAKARGAKGVMLKTRENARRQARSVALEDTIGRTIPLQQRLASVGRLNDSAVEVYFEDPSDDDPARTYTLDPDALVHSYYQVARDLQELAPGPWPGLSGAASFSGAALPGGLILGIHRGLLDVLDDPQALVAARADIREDILETRRAAIAAQDDEVSVGLDGLALVVRSRELEPLVNRPSHYDSI